MLNLWPDLLTYGSIAPFLLRLALGGTFLGYGLKEIIRPQYLSSVWKTRIIGIWDSLVGILLLIGLFTQTAALVAVLELFYCLFLRWKDKTKMEAPVDYLLVMILIAISLLLLGPGLWAFDLPL